MTLFAINSLPEIGHFLGIRGILLYYTGLGVSW